MTKPLFQQLLESGHAQCEAVHGTRAGEYRDSWGTGPMDTLRATLEAFGVGKDVTGSPERLRALCLAAMVDVKISRLGGPLKQDTVVDLCNYGHAYLGAMEQCGNDSTWTIANHGPVPTEVKDMVLGVDLEKEESSVEHRLNSWLWSNRFSQMHDTDDGFKQWCYWPSGITVMVRTAEAKRKWFAEQCAKGRKEAEDNG